MNLEFLFEMGYLGGTVISWLWTFDADEHCYISLEACRHSHMDTGYYMLLKVSS